MLCMLCDHTVIDALKMTRKGTVVGVGHWFLPDAWPASLKWAAAVKAV